MELIFWGWSGLPSSIPTQPVFTYRLSNGQSSPKLGVWNVALLRAHKTRIGMSQRDRYPFPGIFPLFPRSQGKGVTVACVNSLL